MKLSSSVLSIKVTQVCFSQCLMAIPMLLLYEVSIYVSAMAYKKKEKPSESSEQEKEEQA